MKIKHLSIFTALLIVFDQALKIWVKTHMRLEESIVIVRDWFQLRFVENNGAAFGMQLANDGGFDWGKVLLSLLRVALVIALIWYTVHISRRKAPKGILIGMSLIIAGALGNIIDSALYGVIFSASTPETVAHFGGGYAPFMMGRVVDMFYFPLFKWSWCPSWLSFLTDLQGYFFGPIFNLADTYISVAAVYLIVFQHKYFS